MAARPAWEFARAPLGLARADVLERMRRPSFAAALVAMAALTNGMLPGPMAHWRTLQLAGGARPAYGPGCTGALVGLLAGLYFLLVGFYVVRGSVPRDRDCGVGAVLAATRMTRAAYVAAKFASHAFVFGAMIAVAAAVAVVAQWRAGEVAHLAPATTALAVVLVALPPALFASAGAVLFDCIGFLRGGVGNVAWFFVVMGILVTSAVPSPWQAKGPDLLGADAVVGQAAAALHASRPGLPMTSGDRGVGVQLSPRYGITPQPTFAWDGPRWTPAALAGRLLWLVIALLAAACAVPAFDRFAHAPAPRAPRPWRWPWARPRSGAAALPVSVERLADLTPPARGGAFAPLVRAELALLVRGQPAWWWLGALVLAIGQLVAPLPALRSAWLPIASVWPLLALSALGTRERRHGTGAVFFATPHPVARWLAGAWTAGALLVLAAGAAACVRFALAGAWGSALAWAACAAFAPALALACGTWTGRRTTFEMVYFALWYAGPMQGAAALDYTGLVHADSAARVPVTAAAALLLATLAAAGRAREARR